MLYETMCDVWLHNGEAYNYQSVCRRLRLARPTLDDFKRERFKLLCLLKRHGRALQASSDVFGVTARVFDRIESAQQDCIGRGGRDLDQAPITRWLIRDEQRRAGR